jgi:hypothetical protein
MSLAIKPFRRYFLPDKTGGELVYLRGPAEVRDDRTNKPANPPARYLVIGAGGNTYTVRSSQLRSLGSITKKA